MHSPAVKNSSLEKMRAEVSLEEHRVFIYNDGYEGEVFVGVMIRSAGKPVDQVYL